ncbi:unnamed protein product [Camellia sinensis]
MLLPHTQPSPLSLSLTARSLAPLSPPIQRLKDLQAFTIVRVIFQLAKDSPCISTIVVALLSEEFKLKETMKVVVILDFWKNKCCFFFYNGFGFFIVAASLLGSSNIWHCIRICYVDCSIFLYCN